MSKKIVSSSNILVRFRFVIMFFIIVTICIVLLLLLLFIINKQQDKHQQDKHQQQQNKEGFTPKIKEFYNSNIRKIRKHLEKSDWKTTLYKKGAVPFLRYFSIY